jgi:hypothetical protein
LTRDEFSFKAPSIPTVYNEYHDGVMMEGDVFGTNPQQVKFNIVQVLQLHTLKRMVRMTKFCFAN